MTVYIPIWLTPWLFWVGFVFSISVYRRWDQGKLNKLCKLLASPILIPFCILDVVVNYTLLSLVFGWPAKHDYTISLRFETYRRTETGSKRTVADFTCEQLLNPIDPFDIHC